MLIFHASTHSWTLDDLQLFVKNNVKKLCEYRYTRTTRSVNEIIHAETIDVCIRYLASGKQKAPAVAAAAAAAATATALGFCFTTPYHGKLTICRTT